MVNLLKRQRQVDWSGYDAQFSQECLNYFITKKWCKKKSNTTDQYLHLLAVFNNVYRDREIILDMFFKNDPDLLRFLFLHSVFDTNAKQSGDWLEQYMIKKLSLSEDKIDGLFKQDLIPNYLLEQFKIFEPEQVLIEQDTDPVRIEYGMWRRNNSNRIVDPIHITYLDWKGGNVLPEHVGAVMAKYKDIECDKQYVYTPLIEDDLPF